MTSRPPLEHGRIIGNAPARYKPVNLGGYNHPPLCLKSRLRASYGLEIAPILPAPPDSRQSGAMRHKLEHDPQPPAIGHRPPVLEATPPDALPAQSQAPPVLNLTPSS